MAYKLEIMPHLKKGTRSFEFCKFKFLILVVSASCVIAPPHKYSLIDGVRYTDIYEQFLNTSRIPCLALCDGRDECTSINHNKDTDTCELTTHVPRVMTPMAATDPKWKVYYDDRIILAVDQWQSTTFHHINGLLSASYATDGNRENNDQLYGLPCAHTAAGYSFWGMEFERVAEVSHVLIFFRNASELNSRNTNIRLLISATRQDSNSNIGTDCATYVGPPASPFPPTKITCTQPVTGKFLKMLHNNAQYLTLCEVEVYTT